MDPSEIHRLVKEIRSSTSPSVAADTDARFDEFRQRYPKLYQMACNPTMDMDLFNFMISQLQVRYNAKNTDVAASVRDDTDLAVGQELVDVFVKSRLSRS